MQAVQGDLCHCPRALVGAHACWSHTRGHHTVFMCSLSAAPRTRGLVCSIGNDLWSRMPHSPETLYQHACALSLGCPTHPRPSSRPSLSRTTWALHWMTSSNRASASPVQPCTSRAVASTSHHTSHGRQQLTHQHYQLCM